MCRDGSVPELSEGCLVTAKYAYINNSGSSTNVGKNHQNQENALTNPRFYN